MVVKSMQVSITSTSTKTGFLAIRFPFNTTLISLVKQVPGCRWDPIEKIWFIPERQHTVHKLLQVLYDSGLFLAPVRNESSVFCKTKDALTKDAVIHAYTEALQARHYSERTQDMYLHWVQRFFAFNPAISPDTIGEKEINTFLTHLAVKEHVTASTQNQALAALLFLYRHILGHELTKQNNFVRACKPQRLPVVMTREEVKVVLGNLSGDKWLIASSYTAQECD